MQYLAWRVLCGLNRNIEISFLLVGHTKFAPDWCFGLLKQKFRKTLVGCLDDLARVVDQSAHTNHAQLVGLEDGTVLVEQYNWAGYFDTFFRRAAFDGIKSWHHLVFSSETPGKAVIREQCNSEEKTLSLLRKDHQGWKPCPTQLPDVIPPPGLSQERREYLYERIREFVPDAHKDTVCPRPLPGPASPNPSEPATLPPPAASTSSAAPTSATSTSSAAPTSAASTQPAAPTAPAPIRRRRTCAPPTPPSPPPPKRGRRQK